MTARGGALRIVSGGQTGVDLGALDAALARGAPCGGWCPANRRNERGLIPVRYPLAPLARGGYPERTRANVRDADATLIVYFDELEGGTALTARCALAHGKPLKLIDGDAVDVALAVALAAAFVARHAVATLNVAGPRASKAPRAYSFANAVIGGVLDARDASATRSTAASTRSGAA